MISSLSKGMCWVQAEKPDRMMVQGSLSGMPFLKISFKTIFSFVMLMVLAFAASSQVIQQSLPFEQTKQKSGSATARTKALRPISLPFWDDFSTVWFDASSPFGRPDTTRWVNSNSVVINDGTGINAPSINVATFNGLDSVGVPHNPNEQIAKGFGDQLISREIKMGVSSVSVAGRDSVYLSFFYQWKGNQEAPDQDDYLRVDFKNSAGEWEAMETIYGDLTLDPRKFYPKTLKITSTKFFHDKFQFRIRSYGRLSGPFDTWNVDYIYLNKNRTNSTNFPDQAIASSLTSLFGEYRSMPIWQFRSGQQLVTPTFGLHNLKSAVANDPGIEPITYRIMATFKNYLNDGTAPTTERRLGPSTIAISNSVLLPGESRVEPLGALPNINDPALFSPQAKAIDVKLKVTAFTGDVYDTAGVAASDYLARLNEFKGIVDFRANDTTSATFHLENYLAYDDGTAEYSIYMGQPGNRAAMRFDLPIPSDTLIGFQMYFPYYKGALTQTLDFFIYEDDPLLPGEQPGEEPIITLRNQTITKNNSNVFALIDRKYEPIIVNRSFYIGWKEPASEKLHVGMDKSHSTTDKLYQNVYGTWELVEELTGSLMIRPVFGSGTDIPPVGLPEEQPDFAVHPNPNNGTFYITNTVHDVEITDITGRRIGHQLENVGDKNKISLLSVSTGVYIVRWKEKNTFQVRKIVVR